MVLIFFDRFRIPRQQPANGHGFKIFQDGSRIRRIRLIEIFAKGSIALNTRKTQVDHDWWIGFPSLKEYIEHKKVKTICLWVNAFVPPYLRSALRWDVAIHSSLSHC